MARRRRRSHRGSSGELVIRLGVGCFRLLLVAATLALRLLWAALSLLAVLLGRVLVWAYHAGRGIYTARRAGPVRPASRPRAIAGDTRLLQRRAQTLEEYHRLSPAKFEFAIAELLRRAGYHDVRRVGGAGDLGVDIVCRDRAGRSVVVQCKRYAPERHVGSQEMQQFIGMMAVHHHAERGVYVTTSRFTQPARALGHEHGIDLVDGQRLAALTAQVRHQPLAAVFPTDGAADLVDSSGW